MPGYVGGPQTTKERKKKEAEHEKWREGEYNLTNKRDINLASFLVPGYQDFLEGKTNEGAVDVVSAWLLGKVGIPLAKHAIGGVSRYLLRNVNKRKALDLILSDTEDVPYKLTQFIRQKVLAPPSRWGDPLLQDLDYPLIAPQAPAAGRIGKSAAEDLLLPKGTYGRFVSGDPAEGLLNAEFEVLDPEILMQSAKNVLNREAPSWVHDMARTRLEQLSKGKKIDLTKGSGIYRSEFGGPVYKPGSEGWQIQQDMDLDALIEGGLWGTRQPVGATPIRDMGYNRLRQLIEEEAVNANKYPGNFDPEVLDSLLTDLKPSFDYMRGAPVEDVVDTSVGSITNLLLNDLRKKGLMQ